MTVEKLIEVLKKYHKDSQVVFMLPGAKHLYYADKLWTGIDGCPVLECNDSPVFEDIVGMAEQCFEDNYNFMSFEQSLLLKDLIMGAEETEDEG